MRQITLEVYRLDEKLPEIRKGFLYETILFRQRFEKNFSEGLYGTDGQFRYGYDEPDITDEIVEWCYPPSRSESDRSYEDALEDDAS